MEKNKKEVRKAVIDGTYSLDAAWIHEHPDFLHPVINPPTFFGP
jgi:hypothetical protein